jgi:hypothetical protein
MFHFLWSPSTKWIVEENRIKLENLINLTAKKGTYQGKLLSADNQFQSRIQKRSKNLGKKKKKKPSVSWKEEIGEAN